MIAPLRNALAALLALGLPAASLASIPGNLEQEAYENLQHVCVDSEPGKGNYVACEEQEGGDPTAPYTASECAAAGLPAACVIDFVPKVRLKGKLLLALDDQAFDSGGFSIEASGLVLELKKGRKKATFVELFDGSKLGNWNPFDESFLAGDPPVVTFTNVDETAYQFAQGTLFELGLEIRELAASWFKNADLTDAVAVLTAIEADGKRPPLVHDAFDDPLASAASFKIVIEFARTRP